jgi:hypothetical protein
MNIDLTKLTAEQIDAALQASGYTDNQITRVRFVGMSTLCPTPSFHYHVEFDPAGDDAGSGDVFVHIALRGPKLGQLLADF